MARPSRWDEYETTLLIEAYIKVKERGEIKLQVLQELSDNLRQMAVNKGLEIDEVYRNLNGMVWQYSFIEKAFDKSGFGQHSPAKIFRDVVELYINNRKKFDELLKEAKRLVNPGLEVCQLNEEQNSLEKTSSLDDRDNRKENFSEQSIYKVNRADLEAHDKKFDDAKPMEQNIMSSYREEYKYQDEMRMILQQHYVYGYRINSSIELNRFKSFAEKDGIVLPKSDERIKAEIKNVGNMIGDKVYLVSNEILSYLSAKFRILNEEGHNIFFYECIFMKYTNLMEENHISSEDMLKEILKQNKKIVFAEFNNVYFAKNFISLIGRIIENEAVSEEIIRCWGNNPVRESDSFLEELLYIPEDMIKRYLSMNRKFAWVSEGLYVLVDKLIISQTEERNIRDYVLDACSMNGFVSISDIPLGNLVEENYELTYVGLLTAIYNKVLFKDFYLNGKILTKEKSDLDVVTLVKLYLEGRQTCTFDEVNQKVTELAGGKYRYMAYDALYNTMVRIDKDNYVDDSMVDFDVGAIDQALASIITDRGFIAVKEVTTFVLFPICDYAWNHYLLESYCYRFSDKYSLRCRMLNDKNSAIIAEKGITHDYDDMLAKAVARVDIPLQPELVGKYLENTGYTAKKKFAGLENVIEKAALIREEI